jgi:hypothetical protein
MATLIARVATIAAVGLLGCARSQPGPVPIANQPVTDPPAVSAPPPHTEMATLQESSCFGPCPVFTVTLYRDGVLEYEGREHVKLTGAHTGRVTPQTIAAVDKLFADAGYFALDDAYDDHSVSDYPTTWTSYTLDGRRKAITHYEGHMHAPPALDELEEQLYVLLDVTQWVGTLEERGIHIP